ncbi:MAG: single-stranded DNA-binding protein [SAR324 cluster bacterium]|uniref:Single-stranded DNA-binding protein n=1 Tax=SAR324 cluster bacterium TaxID=2024889 RepID=A0A2A4T4W0_9DELT|nr:MAG: single-stranded DNA-binding protein [SAR324 cluster bacterium]
MLNKVQLIGRVGQEPEQKVIASGGMLVTLSLATNERWKDKSGNRQEKTSWHRITLWSSQAKFVAQYVHKGDLVYIEGRIDYQEWDKDGVKQYSTSIVGQTVQKLSWDKNTGGNPQDSSESNWSPSPAQTPAQGDFQPAPESSPLTPKPIFGNVSPVDDLLEDDIPF